MIQDIQPHNYSVSYKVSKPKDSDVLLIYSDKGLLYNKDSGFVRIGDFDDSRISLTDRAIYLFTVDDTDYYTLINSSDINITDASFIPKFEMRYIRPLWHCFIAMLGLHLHTWYANNIYCGKCGNKHKLYEVERALICPECKNIVYPQICPSVIVGILNKDKILLTKYAVSHSRHRNYALVAGYNEIGESMEDTVRREVMEEVGLKVKNIRYYSSQPWPLTGSLLLGYFCEVDGSDDIVLEENELSVAEWLTADEIPDESADASISLTGTMIKEFKNGFRL